MITIKRYPNRKLYNTEARQYITLDGIADLIRAQHDIQVIDHATGKDLTTLTLTQIILESERKKAGYLPHHFLTNLIRTSSDRLCMFHQSLLTAAGLMQLVDEEIMIRIDSLVSSGELSQTQAETLEGKLVHPAGKPYPASPSRDQGWVPLNSALEARLFKGSLPTREDVEELNQQLDELTRQLDAWLMQTNPNPGKINP